MELVRVEGDPDHSYECERDEGRDGCCYRYQHREDDCGEEAADA